MSKEDSYMDSIRAARETLERAQRTLGGIDTHEDILRRQKEEESPTLMERVQSISLAARRINKAWDAAQDLYARVSPWVGPVLRPAIWTAGTLKDAFVWSAYERDENGLKLDEDGKATFSAGRLARVFATSAMIGVTGLVGVDAGLYYGTKFQETVFTTGKEMITPGELYEVTGSTSLPFSTKLDNGKYYHIESSLMFPTLFRPEEDVFALIPKDTAVCQIEGYGIYSKHLKPFFKWAEWYQKVNDVECRPLTERDIDSIIANNISPEQAYKGITP